MRTSKYLGLKSGNWTCSFVGIDRVQPAFTHNKDAYGRKMRSKSPGSKRYYYIFERPTSDGKALKMIRLNASQAQKVLEGWFTVEELAQKKELYRPGSIVKKVSYSFID